MATPVTLNGVTFSIPQTEDEDWSDPATGVDAYLIALATGTLTKSGGTFTLTADADFGANYGLKAAYIKSRAASISSAGILRLGNNESIGWRNQANSANKLLKVNTSDLLEFDSIPLVALALGAADTVLKMNAAATAYEYGKLTNANIDNAAAIAHTKLANIAAGSILLGNASAVPTATAVSGDISITNAGLVAISAGVIIDADVNASAAIAWTKISKTGSNLTDIATRSHTDLSDIGSNTHATIDAHLASGSNPHGVTASQVGLGNVDNTSDATKNAAAVVLTGKTISGVSNTLTNIPAATAITGSLPIANGGTGQATANAALNALLPSQASASSKVLSSDGTNTSWAAALTTALTAANIFVGNASNIATAVAPTGEVALTNAGVTSLKPIVNPHGTTTGTVTLTASDRRQQLFAQTAAMTIVLPTTSILAGEIISISGNSVTYSLTIQASNLSELTIANSCNQAATIGDGNVTLMALQATPTTPAHWRVLNVQEEMEVTGNFIGGLTTAYTMRVQRNNFRVNASIRASTGTGSTTEFYFTALPTRFDPAAQHQRGILLFINGATALGKVTIETSGNIAFGTLSGSFSGTCGTAGNSAWRNSFAWDIRN